MISIFGFEIPKDYIELILFGFTFVGGVLGFFLRQCLIRYQTYCREHIEAGRVIKVAFTGTLDRIKNAKSFHELDIIWLRDQFADLEDSITKFQINLSERRSNKKPITINGKSLRALFLI